MLFIESNARAFGGRAAAAAAAAAALAPPPPAPPAAAAAATAAAVAAAAATLPTRLPVALSAMVALRTPSPALTGRACARSVSSASAALSTGKMASAWLLSWWVASIALYGEVMTSSSADGKMEVAKRSCFGYSSCSAPSRYVPSPDPVPPPRE